MVSGARLDRSDPEADSRRPGRCLQVNTEQIVGTSKLQRADNEADPAELASPPPPTLPPRCERERERWEVREGQGVQMRCEVAFDSAAPAASSPAGSSLAICLD